MGSPLELRPDEQGFVERYLVNGNNASAAMREVRPDITPGGASVKAHRLLQTDKVRFALQTLAHEMGITDRFRLQCLHEALRSQHVTETVTETANGTIKQTTRRMPTPIEVARVVDVLNKTTGVYEANRAVGSALSADFKALARRYAPRISKRTRAALAQADMAEVIQASVTESEDTVCLAAAACGACALLETAL